MIFRNFVCWIFKSCYSEFNITGLENLISPYPIILAPNHTNGLCDALAIQCLINNKVMFLAKADIFKSRIIAKILKMLGLIPIYRKRDGLDMVRRNNGVFDYVNETILHNNIPLCIFPEGTHRAKHSLIEPLNKGIFRIALEYNETYKSPVNIIPVAINYENHFKLGTKVNIVISNPITVYNENNPKVINNIQQTLTQRLKHIVSPYLPIENYTEHWKYYETNRIKQEIEQNRANKYEVNPLILLFCFIISLPIIFPAFILRGIVSDDAFYTSIEFVFVFIFSILTLGLIFPIWKYYRKLTYIIYELTIIDENLNNER